MTYGRNPNSVPYGGAGRTEIPLPGAKPVGVVQASPMLVRKAGVADGEDTASDYGSVDPNYTEDDTVEQSDGLFSGMTKNVAQPGEEQIDLINGDPSEDDIIYGTDDGEGGNGIGDDTIEGDDSILGGPLSDEEMDKVIFGEDGGELDSIIEGSDPDEMSDTEMDAIIYGEPDKPEPPKVKKVVYHVGKPKSVQQRPTSTGMGMTQ